MPHQAVSVLDGNTFVVSDRHGDLDPDARLPPHGFFSEDTRFVSRWRLTVQGQPTDILSRAHVDYFIGQFFLVSPSVGFHTAPPVGIIRQRLLGDVWLEDVIIVNHRGEYTAVAVALDLEIGYYGTADATPLFLILLDEYERWTGDAELARALEGAARSPLQWIDRYGDLDGDGYVEYQTRNPQTGLQNQCWKDSWNSIAFADGRLADGPIATCEIQGYVTTPNGARPGWRARRGTIPRWPSVWRLRRRRCAATATTTRPRGSPTRWCARRATSTIGSPRPLPAATST
jgi:hypothetical protein